MGERIVFQYTTETLATVKIIASDDIRMDADTIDMLESIIALKRAELARRKAKIDGGVEYDSWTTQEPPHG